jgi:dipeptidyl-peptidase-4
MPPSSPSRPLLLVLFLFLFLPVHSSAAASAAEDPHLAYFRDLTETRSYTLGRPFSPKLTPDGKHALFLRSAPRDPTLKLYELDLATGHERELLTPAQLLGDTTEALSAEEKARRERSRQSLKGFTTYQLSRDGTRLLVTLSGKLYLVERASLRVTELPGRGWIDPRFSPDGRTVAAAGADRELHVIDVSVSPPTTRAVTTGATATLSHGTAEFVAQEEMNRSQGYWWSPDSQSLVFQTTDESDVEVRYVADALHPATAPTKFFYPRAGTPNAKVSLSLVTLKGGTPRPIAWDHEKFPYLAEVTWKKNAPLTLLVQNRAQTEQVLLAVDSTSLQSRELLRETDAAWLNLDRAGSFPHWLEDGSQFLWSTESRGSWQVELRSADGKLVRALTPLTWRYRGFVGLDETSATLFASGSLDPRQGQVWRFPLSGGSGTPLYAAPGQHSATYAKEARLLIHSSDTPDGRASSEVTTLAGQPLAALPSVAETPPKLPGTEITRTTGPLAFDAALTRPRAFDAKKKYPVILQVYAGPTSKTVNAGLRGYFNDQWVADQGYVVVRIDGRGTPAHGRDWERAIKGNFIDIALADQISGLRALAQIYPELDLTRVGVTGWSFGGYFAAMAAIRRPDIFQAAVVGAPVITWENYDTHYTERYLGLPQFSPEAYRVSNVTTYAAQSTRPLLLIHGLTDDNVYFQHTLQLADALYLAGKPYELLPMLGTHMVSDPLVKLRQQTRIIDFLNRSLQPTTLR